MHTCMHIRHMRCAHGRQHTRHTVISVNASVVTAGGRTPAATSARVRVASEWPLKSLRSCPSICSSLFLHASLANLAPTPRAPPHHFFLPLASFALASFSACAFAFAFSAASFSAAFFSSSYFLVIDVIASSMTEPPLPSSRSIASSTLS